MSQEEGEEREREEWWRGGDGRLVRVTDSRRRSAADTLH